MDRRLGIEAPEGRIAARRAAPSSNLPATLDHAFLPRGVPAGAVDAGAVRAGGPWSFRHSATRHECAVTPLEGDLLEETLLIAAAGRKGVRLAVETVRDAAIARREIPLHVD